MGVVCLAPVGGRMAASQKRTKSSPGREAPAGTGLDPGIAPLCRGDPVAWARFEKRYAPRMRGAIRRTLVKHSGERHDEDCQDLLQDVLLALCVDDFRLLRTYDPRRASLGTWLGLVARNTAFHCLRSSARNQAHRVDPAGSDEGTGRLTGLWECYPRGLLSERQSSVLRLLYEAEMTVAEAADALGIKEQTIRSTRHKAIRKLRRFYESHWEGGLRGAR